MVLHPAEYAAWPLWWPAAETLPDRDAVSHWQQHTYPQELHLAAPALGACERSLHGAGTSPPALPALSQRRQSAIYTGDAVIFLLRVATS